MTGKRKLIVGLVGGGFLLAGYLLTMVSDKLGAAYSAYSLAVVGVVGAVIAGNVASKFSGAGTPPAAPTSGSTP